MHYKLVNLLNYYKKKIFEINLECINEKKKQLVIDFAVMNYKSMKNIYFNQNIVEKMYSYIIKLSNI